MSARKISVVVDGVKLSRKTERNYSHVVVGKLSKEKELSANLKSAEERERDHYAYKSEVAANQNYVEEQLKEFPTLGRPYFEKQQEEAKEYVAKPIEFYIEKAMQRVCGYIAKNAAKGAYDAFVDIAWCGRYDLALKQLSAPRNPNWYDVRIVEVPAQ